MLSITTSTSILFHHDQSNGLLKVVGKCLVEVRKTRKVKRTRVITKPLLVSRLIESFENVWNERLVLLLFIGTDDLLDEEVS